MKTVRLINIDKNYSVRLILSYSFEISKFSENWIYNLGNESYIFLYESYIFLSNPLHIVEIYSTFIMFFLFYKKSN